MSDPPQQSTSPAESKGRTASSSSTADRMWTSRDLLNWMSDYFTKRNVDSPRLSAEILLSHVIGCERLRLYMEVDRPASPDELKRLRGLVQRAGKHEPIAYLLGEGWFFGLPLKVTPATLIPRPSTETLVEYILQHHRKLVSSGERASDAPLLVADIGTGSGCIAIALAKNLPASARVIATDISASALAVARENAVKHGIDESRITFMQGDLLNPIDTNQEWCGHLDYLVSNPPYIRDSEWKDVESNVKDYEPVSALRAGVDGLDVIRPLIQRAAAALKPGTGVLAVEIAASQEDEVLGIVAECQDLTGANVLKDHEGFPRVLVARHG